MAPPHGIPAAPQTNAKHQRQIDELKAIMEDFLTAKDEPLTDFDYLRFLQTANFDVQKAAKGLKFRVKFQRVSPHRNANYEPALETRKPFKFLQPGREGVSKDGLFLVYEWKGKTPVGPMKTDPAFNWRDFYLYRAWAGDRTLKMVHERERETGMQSGVVTVIDIGGMDFLGPHGFMSTVKDLIRYHAEFYLSYEADFTKKVIVFYPGTSLKRTFSVLSMFLPQGFKKSLSVISSTEELLKEFAPEALPVMLGGKLKVNLKDPNVAMLPDSNYKDPVDRPDYSELFNDHTNLSIPHGRSLHATIIKTDPGSAEIDWSYHSDGPVDLGVFRYPLGSVITEVNVLDDEWVTPFLTAMPLMDNYHFPETGKVPVSEPGIYVFRLHYRHGWMWSHANVHCRVRCLANDSTEEATYQILQ